MSGRLVSKAEGFETAYQAFQDINFTSFDYNTIKQSMIDYVKLYFPETYNDYIESSEFVAILELFAYLGEILIYRVDVAAHENFLPTAQRKQSVLRLAKLISYNPSRNLPARGLVKITSVRTTENVIDSRSANLANRTITWNDPNNPFWKEQFLLVLNRILAQPFGSVTPSERVQVQDVLFELYQLNNSPTISGVLGYNAAVGDVSLPMELVPVALNENGPYERRPELNSRFSIVYGMDGLGDSSNTTGFFMFTKQGTIQRTRISFDGRTPNQTYDLNVNNINEIDLWVNNVDPTTNALVDDGSNPYGRSGEWVPVDLENAQNITFNTHPNRNKYEVESLENDSARLVFGDGAFADIPSGSFDIWYRISANQNVSIPQTAVVGVQTSFGYSNVNGQTETLSLTFSLIGSLQNASESETIDHIRQFAPGVYYTQDRMVNARDYNTFMLQDPSILKLKSLNRTFAGESEYSTYFNDPSEYYDNVKMFGTDLALYYKTFNEIIGIPTALSVDALILNNIQPLLADPELYMYRAVNGYGGLNRIEFTPAEVADISFALSGSTFPVYIYYNNLTDTWTTTPSGVALITVNKNVGVNYWVVENPATFFVAESPEKRFWFTEQNLVTVFDTLNAKNDVITVLPANINAERSLLLSTEYNFNIVNNVTNDLGLPDAGLPNIHQVQIMPQDENEDGYPDDLILNELFHPTITIDNTWSGYQYIDFGGSKTLSSPTGLTDDTSGYQEVSFAPTPNNADSTGYPAETTLTGTVVIDGVTINLSVSSDTIPTFGDLVTYLSSAIGTRGSVSLNSPTIGALRITSSTTGISSTAVVLGTVFTSLGNTPVIGVSVAGTVAPTYTLSVTVDGAPQGINVAGGSGQTIEQVLSLLNAGLMGATASIKNGNIIIISASSGVSSSITGVAGTLFASMTGYLGLGAAVMGASIPGGGLEITLPTSYITNRNDITVVGDVNSVTMGVHWNEDSIDPITVNVYILSFNGNTTLTITVRDYVYFARDTLDDPFEIIPATDPNKLLYDADVTIGDTDKTDNYYWREPGRDPFNFLWMHRAPTHHLIDPAATNIIDTLIITRSYYENVRRWLADQIPAEPVAPTPLDLRLTYGYLLTNKMISDTVVLKSGKFKYLFGKHAPAQLQATLKIIRTDNRNLTDNQIKLNAVTVIRSYFDIDKWEFGETFYFTELAAAIHQAMPSDIETVILVPTYANNYFGDMFQVNVREDELLLPSIGIENIEIVESLTKTNIRQIDA